MQREAGYAGDQGGKKLRFQVAGHLLSAREENVAGR